MNIGIKPKDGEICSLKQLPVFCNQRSKLLVKFVFEKSAFRFNI